MNAFVIPVGAYGWAETSGRGRGPALDRLRGCAGAFAPFTVGWTAAGLPELVDAHGGKWGVFATEQLAQATAERLSK